MKKKFGKGGGWDMTSSVVTVGKIKKKDDLSRGRKAKGVRLRVRAAPAIDPFLCAIRCGSFQPPANACR